MTRKRVALTHRNQRSVLTDMLPFEVPPTFSNRGFYRFLRDHSIEIINGRVRWICDDDKLDLIMRILFGFKPRPTISIENVSEWGKSKIRRYVELKSCRMNTIPFNFRVSHNLDGRTLTIVHPRNQLQVASFYANHSALILYYSSLSEFSIRRPTSVSKYVFFDDKLHQQKLETYPDGVEEAGKEYEQIGSYFVYQKYRNIHRFFESYQYHRAEKKYDAMIQVDVSKCFDSIYTHSIVWSLLGKEQTKFNLEESKTTFADTFDGVMQNLNHKETNGIVIGPEFSRIFAELILQSIDVQLERSLWHQAKLVHKRDYEIFRYVDDYFIFYNAESAQLKIVETLQEILKTKKLSINSSKIKKYQKPIITEITIAKEKIQTILNVEIDPLVEASLPKEDGGPTEEKLLCSINLNRLIIRYKAAIKEAGVDYSSILNYTFSILERKVDKLLKSYLKSDRVDRDQNRLFRALISISEFSFFIYSASPKVIIQFVFVELFLPP